MTAMQWRNSTKSMLRLPKNTTAALLKMLWSISMFTSFFQLEDTMPKAISVYNTNTRPESEASTMVHN